MVNHARSLLLNKPPTGNKTLGRLGEEFIDPAYRPVNDGRLDNLRRTLFGADPDAWTINYRAAQYMAVLHSNVRTVPYVLSLDPRTTYRSGRVVYDTDFGCFLLNAPTTYDPPYKAWFNGVWAGDDANGHNYYEFQVRLSTTSAANCYIERLNPYLKVTIPQVTDQTIALTGDTSFSIKNYQSATNTDITWRLRLVAKPQRTLVQIAEQLREQLPVLEDLWSLPGGPAVMANLRTMFKNSRSFNDTLSCVLLTVIHYQEYLRGRE